MKNNLSKNFHLPVNFVHFTAALLILTVVILAGSIHAQADMKELIEISQDDWETLDIENYIMTFQFAGVWTMYEAQIRVENGYMEDIHIGCDLSIIPMDSCILPFGNLNELNIDMMFDAARQAVEHGDGKFAVIGFDETYHFPDVVSFNDPEIYDEEYSFHVIAFDVIDPEDPTPTLDWQQIDLESIEPNIDDNSLKPDADTDLQHWITEAQAAWAAQEITDYQLTLHWSSFWTAADYTLRVENSNVVEIVATCDYSMGDFIPDSGCWLPSISAQDLSIPGLFANMRTIAELDREGDAPFAVDATNSFPVWLFYDERMIVDEEWSISVVSFEAL